MKELSIDKKKFEIYLKYINKEDIRGTIKVPKNKLTEKEFRILSDIIDKLKDYNNLFYSKELKKRLKKEIDKLKPYLTKELFQMLNKEKYNNEI